ncbi:MAG TPA: helix-turn-helix domain-containing protein [Gammaproteobacteria bacterium]|nr:helix-turn-helix domain-containing protein [Gammaproteobacteria bacterium]
MAELRAETGADPGTYLRAAREQHGLSLHQVAVELHVSDFIIEALERGDYAVLGGAVFVRGHLRNYARALGVAEGEVLSLYEQAQNKLTVPGLVTQHSGGSMSPRAREWYMRAATGSVLLILVVLAVSWWQRRPEERAEPVQSQVEAAPLPAAATTTTPLTLAAVNSQAAAQQGAASLATPLAPPPVKAAAPRAQREEHKPASVTAPATAPAAAPAPTRQVITGAGDAGSLTHAKFILNSASWIEVYDAGGKRLYYDLAPAGDTLDLSGAGPLQVFLGNAPGVSVELNGAAFDIKQYSRADNTARFKLGAAGDTGN